MENDLKLGAILNRKYQLPGTIQERHKVVA
jgi:hypothetical protein